MRLENLSSLQRKIADELWCAESQEEVDAIVEHYGRNGELVRDLMILEALDMMLLAGNGSGDGEVEWISEETLRVARGAGGATRGGRK